MELSAQFETIDGTSDYFFDDAAMTDNSTPNNRPPRRTFLWFLSRPEINFADWSKDTIFGVSMTYAVLMLAIAVVHRCGLIDLFEMDDFLVPMSIPWFGAIGAVIISLQAVFKHREDWDPAYNYWHLARPLVGAVVGVMSFLILSVIVTLAGSSAPSPDSAPSIANMNIYHVLAFIVGYREETFRDLLKRVTDLILRPGGAQDQQ